MKKGIFLIVIIILVTFSLLFCERNMVSAKTIIKNGVYTQDGAHMYKTKVIKYSKKRIVIKCKLDKYKLKGFKNNWNRDYKTMKKAKYSFKLSRKIKYYSAGRRINEANALAKFKSYNKYSPGFVFFVKNKKVYRINFFVA